MKGGQEREEGGEGKGNPTFVNRPPSLGRIKYERGCGVPRTVLARTPVTVFVRRRRCTSH